jgi:hypothetical protein
VLPPVEIPVDPEVKAGVIATLMEAEKRWNSQDFATLLELWDDKDSFPTYLAEEQSQWFVGWPRLNSYLNPPKANPAIEAIREEYSGIPRSRDCHLVYALRNEGYCQQSYWRGYPGQRRTPQHRGWLEIHPLG